MDVSWVDRGRDLVAVDECDADGGLHRRVARGRAWGLVRGAHTGITYSEGGPRCHPIPRSGLELDYINADMNERGWSAAFVKALRAAMDAAGFNATQLVCGDDAHAFSCAATAASDPTLRDIIVALGSHGPQGNDPVAEGTGLPLWSTETHVTDNGGTDLVTVLADGYLLQNLTSFAIWNAVSAYNPALFSPDWGLFRAWWPFCGHYELGGRSWVYAHHTQSTLPGWRYLSQVR